MKKTTTTKLIQALLIFSITICKTQAQVGVGNTTPNGSLDITSTNDGLLIPRLALVNTSTATVITPTESELIYNTATVNDVTPGFYYWDSIKWIRVIGTDSNKVWNTNGNSNAVAASNFIGTTDANDFVVRTNNSEKVRVLSNGNVGIGMASPGAKLEVVQSTPSSYTGIFRASGTSSSCLFVDNTGNSSNTAYFSNSGSGSNGLYSLTTNINSNAGNFSSTGAGSNGVAAFSISATGVYGQSTSGYGVYGKTSSAAVGGVLGYNFDNTIYGMIGYSTYSFYGNGAGFISGNWTAGAGFTTSDKRLKKNILKLENGIQSVMKLNPVEYDKKETLKATDYNSHEIGFIAQEIKEIFPNAVKEVKIKDQEDILAVNYTSLIPVLTKAIQEQQSEIELLKSEIQLMKEQIQSLLKKQH